MMADPHRPEPSVTAFCGCLSTPTAHGFPLPAAPIDFDELRKRGLEYIEKVKQSELDPPAIALKMEPRFRFEVVVRRRAWRCIPLFRSPTIVTPARYLPSSGWDSLVYARALAKTLAQDEPMPAL